MQAANDHRGIEVVVSVTRERVGTQEQWVASVRFNGEHAGERVSGVIDFSLPSYPTLAEAEADAMRRADERIRRLLGSDGTATLLIRQSNAA